MNVVFHVVGVLVGAALVGSILLSAVATFVVPRGVPARLTRIVFVLMRKPFDLRMRMANSYTKGESAMAWYAPISLLALVAVWLVFVVAGFTLIFRSVGIDSWRTSVGAAGSSLTTLGVVGVSGLPQQTAAFVDAALGVLLLALLITYLPTIYASFQRREVLVTRATMSAGIPPTGVALLRRYHEIAGFDALEQAVWQPWIAGFVDIDESHTSTAALAFFRSPRPERHWVTAVGAVLDAAALRASTVDLPRQPSAELCLRAGYLALQHIADFYGIQYDADPTRGDPIALTKDEWLAARAELASVGVPVREDVDESWLDFAGWRVNYESVLLVLAGFVAAPYAPWNADRGVVRHRPPLIRTRQRGG